MVEKIIGFSARNKFFVILVYVGLIIVALGALQRQTVDAIPDISDTQVIVYTTWDRSPDLIEDQVTYPIITSLLGAPHVKAIRGFSDFGFSYVYVIFEDNTDIYWARSRVLEYLSKVTAELPEGAKTQLGPDASGVGWVYQYALLDKGGRYALDELRSLQDWTLRYAVQSVPGVAEVASIGGFERQYQVVVDREKLIAHDLSIQAVAQAVQKANVETGGRMVEIAGMEFMVRSHGYIKSVEDIKRTVLKVDDQGTPVYVENVADVAIGPDIRRGVSDLDGQGNTVGGIVVMRHGENAARVIQRVKDKLLELKTSLPEGVEIVTTYDRSELINGAITTLKHKLIEEMVIVSFVILLFLWHFPSAIVPIVTIPIAVLLSFIPMYYFGISSNIMSLAGIAISVGVLVDGAIVEVENAYKRLEEWWHGGQQGDFHEVRLKALQEVGGTVFFSLLVIAVSFLPVFTLVDAEGRLFTPLAWTKNLTMIVAAIMAVTLDPALRMSFARMDPFVFRPAMVAGVCNTLFVGRYYAEAKHPISRVLFALYEPVVRLVLRHPLYTVLFAVLLMLTTIPAYLRLGKEFMPPLNEGTILYMPTTLPGISAQEAEDLLVVQDNLLRTVPEVERVFGKAGRADTATDPAPFSMMETTVILKPNSEWRQKERWYTESVPQWAHGVLATIWPNRISWEELIADLDKKLRLPGLSNAWTMPIKARTDMLATGIKTPLGIKVFGGDVGEIEKVGASVENVLRELPETRTVFAERVSGGYYVDFDIRREQLARYGLSVADVQETVSLAIGGDNVTRTVEGRARYGVSVRYAREERDTLESMSRVLVRTPNGAHIPLREVATLKTVSGPSMIRDESGMLAGYVYIDVSTSDLGGYVEKAKKLIEQKVELPNGYQLVWSGQYENMKRVRERLQIIVPITLLLIFCLIYLNTSSVFKTALVMSAVPFSLIGAVWTMYFLGYHISIASWVGMIALMGLDAETGVFMLMYLDMSVRGAKARGMLSNDHDLQNAIVDGAVKRIRPKAMTVAALFMGLLPIMWSAGVGADMMKRIVAPMIGGLASSFALELLVYPAVYLLWHRNDVRRGGTALLTSRESNTVPDHKSE